MKATIKGQFTPWTISLTMEKWHFSMVWYMVQLPWSGILRKNNVESLWAFNRCKPNVDQEEWPCTKKWMCWSFCNICPTRAILNIKIKSNQSWPFPCPHFSSLLKNIIKISLYHHLCAIGPALFYQITSFASPTTKPIGPCQWIV
jgi:hypothetical protein